MNPREEQLSLKSNPLPFEGDDNLLLNRIAAIDTELAVIDTKIRDLNAERMDLSKTRSDCITRAVSIGKTEDAVWKIETVVKKGARVADPAKLKTISPEKWTIYVSEIKDKAVIEAKTLIQKAHDNLETTINVGIADKIFGKTTVDECSTRLEMVEYMVVKKE